MQRSTFTIIATVGALAAAFFTGTSIAVSNRAEPPAAKIATVNIQNIFENLQERKDKLDQLQKEANRLEDEFKIKNAALNRDREEVAKLPEGADKDAKMEAVVDRDVQAQIEIKKVKARLEKAQADTIRMIFDKIQKQSASTGSLAGYTMVMAADDWVTISPRATSAEATQVMSLRRFLYIDNKVHDITADVLKSLNDTYAATKPSTPTAAVPGAPTPANPAPAPAPTTPPKH